MIFARKKGRRGGESEINHFILKKGEKGRGEAALRRRSRRGVPERGGGAFPASLPDPPLTARGARTRARLLHLVLKRRQPLVGGAQLAVLGHCQGENLGPEKKKSKKKSKIRCLIKIR